MLKICFSGPAASGKTYLLNEINEGGLFTSALCIKETARRVNDMYPELAAADIKKFRDMICDFQRNIEEVVELMSGSEDIHIYDRGILDNLAFLYIYDRAAYEIEIAKVEKLYQSGRIKPYDYIFYFDIALNGASEGITPFLRRALDDPLRKNTINVHNYAGHAAEFRNAFITVQLRLGVKVTPITCYPTKKGYSERNTQIKDLIFQFSKGVNLGRNTQKIRQYI
jgi:hypothetical protein